MDPRIAVNQPNACFREYCLLSEREWTEVDPLQRGQPVRPIMCHVEVGWNTQATNNDESTPALDLSAEKQSH